MAPMPSVNHTCLRASAPSSRSGLEPCEAGIGGTHQRTMPTAASAITPTNTNAARQPKCSPRAAAMGTPTSVALVSPSITHPTARARRPGGARAAATSAATPK